MDNYRAWFKAKTDTFKKTYSNTVDNYFDLVLSQIDAFTNRTGDESPQELSRMIKHMEDTNTLYQNQLNWLSSRYFAGKATFTAVSSTIHDSTSLTNAIYSQPNQVATFAEYSRSKQQAKQIASEFGNSTVNTSSGDNLHPIEIDSESECESDTEVAKVKSTSGRAHGQQNQRSSVATALKRKRSDDNQKIVIDQGPSSPGTSIISSPGPRKRTLSIDGKRLRGVVQPILTHTCSICYLSFPCETLLDAHVLNEHNQQQQGEPLRPFACELCDKTFAQKAYLISHLLVHSGLKMARCTWPDCSYDSAFKANVIAHIRTVHFKLPQTKKKQTELNIVDDRDPHDFFEKIHHGLSGN